MDQESLQQTQNQHFRGAVPSTSSSFRRPAFENV
uniref:Rho GDP-dissociation inhibitor 1 n=1 Tax=Rhizophora mucronata TaxID=61149 RepID=A0A2P2JBN0_RHIMU